MKPSPFPGAVAFATALFAFTEFASAQLFVNMDFEEATIPPTAPGAVPTFPASAAQCFPGWIVGPQTTGPGTSVAYNDVSLGGPVISLMGPDFPNFVNYTPLQGCYSVYMQYFNDMAPPTLSQTGLIPAGTQSLNFLVGSGADNVVVTLNGINVPLVSTGVGLSGDIPAGLAGTVATLTFTTKTGPAGYADNYYFDDVQFYPAITPEPSEFALLTLGAFSFAFCRRRKSATHLDCPRRIFKANYVAQICNLLYRRIAFGSSSLSRKRQKSP